MAKDLGSGRDTSKGLDPKKSIKGSKKPVVTSMVATDSGDFVASISRKAFRLLFDEVKSPILILQDGQVVYINKKGWEKFGYSTNRTIGKKVKHLIAKRVEKFSQETAFEGYFQAISGKQLPSLTIPIITENGDSIPIEPHIALIEYNRKPALLVVAHDLRQAAIKSETSSEELANMALLVHTLAENLKNPMQSVKNAAYYFAQQLKGTQEYHRASKQAFSQHYGAATKMLEIIDNAVNRADQSVTVLLEYTDQRQIKSQPLDIEALLKDAISSNDALSDIKIDMTFDELPLIFADRQDIVCAFTKIIEFCAQFMPVGGVITISVVESAHFVEISLTGSGIVVSKEKFDSVFKPFQMFNDMVLGIGLPICKRFIERNGGTVKLCSVPGKGTAFVVRLPCVNT